MSKTRQTSGFKALSSVRYHSKASGSLVEITPEKIIDIIVNTNEYLYSLADFFSEVDFNFYSALGQRNLSGFIGEIFVKSFEKTTKGYRFNPHGDGRPDILDVTTEEAKKYLEEKCFTNTDEGLNPLRGKLAPFRYGGLEVKASIGNPVANYRQRLPQEQGVSTFVVGLPRIEYLSSITYWGHHTSCENLIGLFYDYSTEEDKSPQVMAVMHSELNPETDWHAVSVGKTESKKTSNTSLTTTGRSKLYHNVVAVVDDARYIEKLKQIGLKLERQPLRAKEKLA